MKNQSARRSMVAMLICGILGCILMGASDWLMIYGDPSFEGALPWLTKGAAGISPGRNALALALAVPAVILYAIALFGVRKFLTTDQTRKIYFRLTAVGMTPWLCLHLFYTMILYLFGWLTAGGEQALAFAACEAVFSQFSWVIPVGEVIMLLPFFYLFVVILAGKSCFSRWMCLNNPLLIYMLLKLVTLLLPVSAFRLAFTNGLMSESMAVLFILLLVFMTRKKPEEAEA